MTWTDRKRVLIAEDDGLVRETLRTRLGVAGYEVHVARTGTEALQRILAIKPDVLVLDINMPELDGFGVMEALRAEQPDLKLPIMVLSARRNEDDVKRAVALGARDYVLKAQAETDLLGRIQRLLRRTG
ncbi:MAG: response regulator [Brevundimonas sp.]|nr:MAG: response regulator [Brevundimonas sp.]